MIRLLHIFAFAVFQSVYPSSASQITLNISSNEFINLSGVAPKSPKPHFFKPTLSSRLNLNDQVKICPPSGVTPQEPTDEVKLTKNKTFCDDNSWSYAKVNGNYSFLRRIDDWEAKRVRDVPKASDANYIYYNRIYGKTLRVNGKEGRNNRVDKHLLEKDGAERQYFYAQETFRKSRRKKSFFLSRHESLWPKKIDEEDWPKSLPLPSSKSSISPSFLPLPSSLVSPSSSSSSPSSLPSLLSSHSSSKIAFAWPLSSSTKYSESNISFLFPLSSPFEANYHLSKSRKVRESSLSSPSTNIPSLSHSLKSPSSSPGTSSGVRPSVTMLPTSKSASHSSSFRNLSTAQSADSQSSSSTEIVRVNVVDENPSLDVGPLMQLTVAEGSTARLPCSETPLSKEDSVRLILWYRNDTSRPLLSYDAREEQKPRRSDIFSMSKEAFQRRDFILFYRSRWLESEPRIALGRGGESLILLNVRHRDHAEYRCTVHYKKLPSITYRLQLLVTDKIANVNIYDSEGRTLSGNYGPFVEGAEVSVLCKANCTTNFKNLTWLIEGEAVTSSFGKVGTTSGNSTLQLKLQKSFTHATLTCRSTCIQYRSKGGVETSLVDNGIVLDMVYVPETRLFVDAMKSKEALGQSEGVKGGVLQVLEGQTLAFVCLVRSNPKSYSVTWLSNGQVFDIQGERWTRDNNSLTIKEIRRQDSGLYTCVASNREGDGQSNAISIKVAYPPYCKGPNNKHFTIGKNSSIVLQCNVDAYPNKVTFSWRKTGAYPLPRNVFYPNVFSHDVMTDITLKNRVSVTGDHPELIELGPETADERAGNFPLPQGPPLPHFEDPKLPTRSLLTIVPDADHIGIICLSRNEIGRTNTPCFFRISVVDSPDPPVGCHVNSVGISSLKVDCKLRTSPEDAQPPSQQTPGLSPVRSPGIKGASVLEVWARGTLVTNQTSDRGHWYVNKLPPDTDLRLRIYSLSTHIPSEPVVLFARTLPKEVTLLNGPPPGTSSLPTDSLDSSIPEEEDGLHWPILIGCVSVGTILLLSLAMSGLVLLRLCRRRRRRRLEALAVEERPSSVGEGDPWAAHSYPESYDTIATSPMDVLMKK